jgi:DNA-binding CsgD family transcriptional regulator
MASTAAIEEIERPSVAVALQHLSQGIGCEVFPRRLFDFVAALVPNDSGWVVRYHITDPPEVLHTRGISKDLMHFYLDAEPEKADPYLCSWRSKSVAQVETLTALVPTAGAPEFYLRHFQPRARFADEIAIFLPSDERSCLSLFLERRLTSFNAREVAAIRDSFPAIMALHEAHLRAGRSDEPNRSEGLLSRAESLSPREREILMLALNGRSTGEIAQRLVLTKGYIKNCRQRMYRKLGVSSERAMLTMIAPVAHRLAL